MPLSSLSPSFPPPLSPSQGYNSFLLRDLPFDAIQFAVYEQIKMRVKKAVNRDLKDVEVAVVGAVAGGITGAVTTPLDVIKTRLMTQVRWQLP